MGLSPRGHKTSYVAEATEHTAFISVLATTEFHQIVQVRDFTMRLLVDVQGPLREPQGVTRHSRKPLPFLSLKEQQERGWPELEP